MKSQHARRQTVIDMKFEYENCSTEHLLGKVFKFAHGVFQIIREKIRT